MTCLFQRFGAGGRGDFKHFNNKTDINECESALLSFNIIIIIVKYVQRIPIRKFEWSGGEDV